jgi:hypothetical protein
MQLGAARYRRVDLLRVNVVSVAVTDRCVFVHLTFKFVGVEYVLQLLWPCEMTDV